jgi:Uma2 family endonuclease
MHPPVDLAELTLPLLARRSRFLLRIQPDAPLSDDELYDLCRKHRDLRIERTAKGDLIIMPPTGGETGRRNAALSVALGVWAAKDGTGIAFDSSTGFMLPNGAERSPDAAWVKRPRWDALTREQRQTFPPLCPDFVVELLSPSDTLDEVHAKMPEYAENGALLGWMIDPEARRVWVYEERRAPECLEGPGALAGEPLLAGFVLDLGPIW